MKKQLLFILLMLITGYTSAQWSSDPNVNTLVASSANSMDVNKAIADGTGGAIVFFSNDQHLYLQRISAEGVKLWGSQGIELTNGWSEIVSDGNGGVVLFWNEETIPNDYNSEKIYAQHIDAAGKKLWGQDGKIIVNATSEYGLLDNLVKDADGNFGFAYVDYADNQLYAQKVDGNGVPLWSGGVALAESTNEDEPDGGFILADGGGFIVVWLVEYEIAGEWGDKVFWQKLNADGTKNGSNVFLYDFPPTAEGETSYELSGIAPDGSGGFYVSMVEDSGTEAKLYLQRILGNGTKVFGGLGVEVDAAIGKLISGSGYTYMSYGVALESDGEGGVIVGWTDTRSGNDGLYAQRFNSSGTKLWGGGTDITVVPSLVSSIFYDGYIKRNANGDFVFMVSKDVSNGTHLYLQKISLSGGLLHPAAGIFAAGRNTMKFGEMVVSGNTVILVWDEQEYDNVNYNYTYNIYAQSIFSDGLLPVSLVRFNAVAKNNGALLTWATASELNNSHFVIEKSTDDVDFKTLATIGGKGTTNEKSNYQFTDLSFSQSTYYRLTQVDLNGTKVTYHDLVRYVKGLDAQAGVKVYPNPTTDKIFVNTTDIKIGSVVKLINLEGKVLASQTANQGTLVFEVQQLPSGVYFVQYSNAKQVQSQKVVKK